MATLSSVGNSNQTAYIKKLDDHAKSLVTFKKCMKVITTVLAIAVITMLAVLAFASPAAPIILILEFFVAALTIIISVPFYLGFSVSGKVKAIEKERKKLLDAHALPVYPNAIEFKTETKIYRTKKQKLTLQNVPKGYRLLKAATADSVIYINADRKWIKCEVGSKKESEIADIDEALKLAEYVVLAKETVAK